MFGPSKETREAAAALRDLIRKLDALLPVLTLHLMQARGGGGDTAAILQNLLGAVFPSATQKVPPPALPGGGT